MENNKIDVLRSFVGEFFQSDFFSPLEKQFKKYPEEIIISFNDTKISLSDIHFDWVFKIKIVSGSAEETIILDDFKEKVVS